MSNEKEKIECAYCKKKMDKSECKMSVNGVSYPFHSTCISNFLTNRTIDASDPDVMKIKRKKE